MANVVGSFLKCFVSCGALARSMVCESSGGKTQVIYFKIILASKYFRLYLISRIQIKVSYFSSKYGCTHCNSMAIAFTRIIA